LRLEGPLLACLGRYSEAIGIAIATALVFVVMRQRLSTV